MAAGQKVVVATLGTKRYDGDECFTIKKSKIRGVESTGMICAEDEIGIGTDHAGIIDVYKRQIRFSGIAVAFRWSDAGCCLYGNRLCDFSDE